MKIRIDPLNVKVKLLKFSYASLKNFYKGIMFMFATGNSKQIFRSVVISNTIKMVNNPAFRDGFAVSFFPDQDVFSDIAKLIGSWMSLFKSKYIALVPALTAFWDRLALANTPTISKLIWLI